MTSDKSKSSDYKPITTAKNNKKSGREEYLSIEPTKKNKDVSPATDFLSPKVSTEKSAVIKGGKKKLLAEISADQTAEVENLSYSEQKKLEKQNRKGKRDAKLLEGDIWIFKNGHTLTFAGIYLFTFFVFFRPYELVPGFGFLNSGAFILAAATLAIYLPTQLSTEGNLTIFNTEIKCVLAMTLLALFLMPISRDIGLAWETFNDTFIKAIVIFIVMVNVVRTRKRLMSLIWLSLAISVYLSFSALVLYQRGEFQNRRLPCFG